MRKRIALFLATLMTVAAITGCGSANPPSKPSVGDGGNVSSENSAESENAKAADSERLLGAIIWSTDDGLGADSREAIDATAAALGMKVIYRTGAFDAEAQTTDIENLIAAGVEGILITPLVDVSIDEYMKVCETAGIPMQIMFRNIIDEEAYDYCMASDLFAGYVVEDEAAAAVDMIDKMIADGCTTIGLLNREAGNGVVDRRQQGAIAYLEDKGIKYYTTTLSSTASAADAADSTAQLLAAYSDIDGLLLSSGSNGVVDGIITYLEGTDVRLASFDTPADIVSSFDAGNLSMLTTGAQIDPVFATINLYNKLNGTPFSDAPTEINSNYIYLENTEDTKLYREHFDTFKTYSKEEIVNLSQMDYNDFLAEVVKYNLHSVADKK